MAGTPIDANVWKTALQDISRALDSIEQSIRSGARLRASDIKTMLDAVNALLGDLERKD